MRTTTASRPKTRPPHPVFAGALSGLATLALALALSLLVALAAVQQTPAHATAPTYRTQPASPFVVVHDTGSWKAPRYAGTRVPTLGQLLSVMRLTRTTLLLELKHPELYPGSETQVAQELSGYGYIRMHRVYVHSFSASSLARFHRLAPSVPVGMISENGLFGTNGLPWLTTVNPTTCTTAAVVKRAATRDLMVFAWPARPAQAVSGQVKRLVDDGVITDDPAQTRRCVTADEHDLRATGASAAQRAASYSGSAR